MLSKNKLKFINSLKQKKYRDIHKLFVAEGERAVEELITGGMMPAFICGTAAFFERFPYRKNCECIASNSSDLSKITSFSTTPEVVAVFEIKDNCFDTKNLASDLSIFTDNIQNPGNLGTIIRTARWFGIKNILCSPETADIYNPKVVQSTMGSLAAMNIVYIENKQLFNQAENMQLPVYGAFLDGENVYSAQLENKGILILGNEGNGITAETEQFVTRRLYIPPFPPNETTVESLNVAIASAVIMSEFRRRMI